MDSFIESQIQLRPIHKYWRFRIFSQIWNNGHICLFDYLMLRGDQRLVRIVFSRKYGPSLNFDIDAILNKISEDMARYRQNFDFPFFKYMIKYRQNGQELDFSNFRDIEETKRTYLISYIIKRGPVQFLRQFGPFVENQLYQAFVAKRYDMVDFLSSEPHNLRSRLSTVVSYGTVEHLERFDLLDQFRNHVNSCDKISSPCMFDLYISSGKSTALGVMYSIIHEAWKVGNMDLLEHMERVYDKTMEYIFGMMGPRVYYGHSISLVETIMRGDERKISFLVRSIDKAKMVDSE
jgi:hypothetical protein